MNANDISDKIFEAVQAKYARKAEALAKEVFPFIKNVFEDSNNHFENIQIPMSDGLKIIPVVVNLKSAYQSGGKMYCANLKRARYWLLWMMVERAPP